MEHFLYLKKGTEDPVPFNLHDYEHGHGRLHGPSTLQELGLANLKVQWPDIAEYVPVAFQARDGLSLTRFKPNTKEAPLLVKGEGATSGANGVTHLTESLARLPQQVADAVAERMCRTVEVPASGCKSSVWDQIEPQLRGVVRLDLSCTPPCCQPHTQPVRVPPHEWPQGKGEDDLLSIQAGLQFLQGVLPPDITPVPVQGIQWLNAAFCLVNIKLVITMSKTDYLLVHKPAWDALLKELGISLVDGKVSGTSQLRDKLPRLLPHILGFYEAKTPAAMKADFRKARAQAILEHLAAWHMLYCRDAPIVLFGDFTCTHCIHSSNDMVNNIPGVHVASPKLGSDTAEGVWGLALTLLEQAKQRLQMTGAAVSDSDHVQSTSSQPGGAGAIEDMDRSAERDTDMEEAALLNAQAQQLMSVMQHPEMYGAFGLDCPPTTLELGSAEDMWARVKVVSVVPEPSCPEAQGKRCERLPGRE